MDDHSKKRTKRNLMIFILSVLGSAVLAGVIESLCLPRSGGRCKQCSDVRRRIQAVSAM